MVALISLRGTIAESNGGGGLPGSSSKNINFQDVQPLIDQAFMLDGVKAIVLVINSPGGSPCQTNLISSYIRDKTEETKIPVYALVEDIAASGGFWLACAADEIYVDPNSMIGSIGVIYQSVGVNGMMQKIGVEPRIITSVDNKAGLNPMLEYDKTQAKIVKGNVDIIHNNFVDWVKERRPKLKTKDTKQLFSGRVFVGKEAVDMKLVDGINNLTGLLHDKFPDEEDLKVIEIRKKADVGLLGMLGPLFSKSSHVLDQISVLLDTVLSQSSQTGNFV